MYYNAYFGDDEPEDVRCYIWTPNQISSGVVQSLSIYYCVNFFTSQTFVLEDFVEDVKSEYGISDLYPYRYTSDYVTMPAYEGYGYYTEDYSQHKGYIWRYFIEGEPEITYDITMSYSPSGTLKTGTIYSFTAHAFVYNETFDNWDNYECKYEWYVDTNLISSGNSNSEGIFIKEFNFGSAGTHVFEIIIFDIEDVYYASPLYDETFNYLFYTSGGTEPPAGETPIVPPGGVTPIIPTGQGWMDMMTAILPPLVLLMGPTISLAKFGIIGIMVGLSAGVMVGVQMGYFPTYTYFMLILILSIGLVYMATHRG